MNRKVTDASNIPVAFPDKEGWNWCAQTAAIFAKRDQIAKDISDLEETIAMLRRQDSEVLYVATLLSKVGHLHRDFPEIRGTPQWSEVVEAIAPFVFGEKSKP